MEQLGFSIKEHGILESLLVCAIENGVYELVAGERRYPAAKELGLKEVPVAVRDFNDQEVLEIALVENLQREDLNPVETEGILRLLSVRLKMSMQEVSSPSTEYRKKQREKQPTILWADLKVRSDFFVSLSAKHGLADTCSTAVAYPHKF